MDVLWRFGSIAIISQMKFAPLFCFLFLATPLVAEVVEAYNPIEFKKLAEDVELSFYVKEETGLLHWRLKRTFPKGSSTVEPGEGIKPRQAFVYEWNDSTRSCCLATPEFIKVITFPAPLQSSTSHYSAEDFRDIPELSKELTAAVEKMLKEAETGKRQAK
jgi:hypothetical protein